MGRREVAAKGGRVMFSVAGISMLVGDQKPGSTYMNPPMLSEYLTASRMSSPPHNTRTLRRPAKSRCHLTKHTPGSQPCLDCCIFSGMLCFDTLHRVSSASMACTITGKHKALIFTAFQIPPLLTPHPVCCTCSQTRQRQHSGH